VTGADGTSVITDPYTPETSGYQAITEPPDIVIISSDNDSFHCRADLIPGNHETVNALELAQADGSTEIKGVKIRAIEAMEALNHKYHDPDQNGMYRFEVDGVLVGHIGDVGNAFSDAQIEFFKGVDVFLALAGGHPTMELDDLKVVIDAVQPKWTVPMHFRTLTYVPRNSFWIDTFLGYFTEDDIDFAFGYELDITPDTLPKEPRILVMDYVRR
jgi:hypothetical protein